MPTAESDAADILSVRDLEAAAVARILPRIRAAFAARRGSDRYALSAGAAAEEARAVTSADAIRAEPDPAVRAELEAVRADLARVDAVYWRVVAGWQSAARGIVSEGRRKLARAGVAAIEAGDLSQSAMIGLWRGVLRWKPNAGAGPRGFAYDWARAHTQGAVAKGDLCGHGKKGWAIPGRARAARADEPIAPEGPKCGKRTLLLDTLRAPDDTEAIDDEAEARARVAALMAAATPRQRALMEAFMRDGGSLRSAGAAAGGLSRERVRQIFLQIRHGRTPDAPQPETIAGRILAHLKAHPAPITAARLTDTLGADPSAVRKALQKLREGGQILRTPAHPAPLYTRKDSPMTTHPIDTLLRDTAAYLCADPPLPYSEIAARIGQSVPAAERAAGIVRACGLTGAPLSGTGARLRQILDDDPGGLSAPDTARRARLRGDDTAHTLRALVLAGHARVEGSLYYPATPEPTPMPTPAPTNPALASIPCPDLAAAMGIEDADATPAELLDATREMVARDTAQRAQIATLGAERDAARQLQAAAEAERDGAFRDRDDAERDAAECRKERDQAWLDLSEFRRANPPRPVAALTRDDLEARIALWTQARETEATAGATAMEPLFSLLSAKEAETVRAMRLQAAEDLRAMALSGTRP